MKYIYAYIYVKVPKHEVYKFEIELEELPQIHSSNNSLSKGELGFPFLISLLSSLNPNCWE